MTGTTNKEFYNKINNQVKAGKDHLASLKGKIGNLKSSIEKRREDQRKAVADAKKKVSEQKKKASVPASKGYIRPVEGYSPINAAKAYDANRAGRLHGGVDLSVPAGTPIKATASGTVVGKAFHADGFGHVVAIQHADGMQSLYAHMQGASTLNPGDKVGQGQVIGKVGSTGWSTGPHLHFGMGKGLYHNGSWAYANRQNSVNPATLIDF